MNYFFTSRGQKVFSCVQTIKPRKNTARVAWLFGGRRLKNIDFFLTFFTNLKKLKVQTPGVEVETVASVVVTSPVFSVGFTLESDVPLMSGLALVDPMGEPTAKAACNNKQKRPRDTFTSIVQLQKTNVVIMSHFVFLLGSP